MLAKNQRQMKIILRVIPWILFLLLIVFLWNQRPGWLFSDRQEVEEEVFNHHTLLASVEALGKLELVKYNFQEVTELSEKNRAYLGLFKVPDSKAVLISSGEAVGCIDLNLIREEDLKNTEDTLFIRLPQPELCYYKLNLNNSRIYSVDKVVYYKDDKQLIEKAYKTAENQIRNAALNSGILDQTTSNAEVILKPMLEQVSGKKVVFLHQPNREIVERQR
ncbi:hypothetical protein BH23BAC1_BH23BAC1_10780 [soil metagenome]